MDFEYLQKLVESAASRRIRSISWTIDHIAIEFFEPNAVVPTENAEHHPTDVFNLNPNTIRFPGPNR